MNRIHVAVSPTVPATAIEKEQEEIDFGSLSEPATMSYVRITALFNLSGQPAITIPVGLDESRLPAGLQIAGKPYDEATVIRVARACEELGLTEGEVPPVHAERSVA